MSRRWAKSNFDDLISILICIEPHNFNTFDNLDEECIMQHFTSSFMVWFVSFSFLCYANNNLDFGFVGLFGMHVQHL